MDKAITFSDKQNMNETNLLENQPIAWTPSEAVKERAQLTRFMRQIGVSDFDGLYQF
jgi:hypothetical protein